MSGSHYCRLCWLRNDWSLQWFSQGFGGLGAASEIRFISFMLPSPLFRIESEFLLKPYAKPFAQREQKTPRLMGIKSGVVGSAISITFSNRFCALEFNFKSHLCRPLGRLQRLCSSLSRNLYVYCSGKVYATLVFPNGSFTTPACYL